MGHDIIVNVLKLVFNFTVGTYLGCTPWGALFAFRRDAAVVCDAVVLEGEVAAFLPVDRVHRPRLANVPQPLPGHVRFAGRGVALALGRLELLLGNDRAA